MTQPNRFYVLFGAFQREWLGQMATLFFSGLGGVNSQPSTGSSSIPDTFFGNRLVEFTSSVGWDTLNNPGASCGTLLTWHR